MSIFMDHQDILSFTVFGTVIPSVVSASAAYLCGWYTGETALSSEKARSMGFMRGVVIGGALAVFVGIPLMSVTIQPISTSHFFTSIVMGAVGGTISGSIAGTSGGDDGYFFANLNKHREFKE